jgi:hypothetical protein
MPVAPAMLLPHATHAYCAMPVWHVLHGCRAANGIGRLHCVASAWLLVMHVARFDMALHIGFVLFLMLLLHFVYKHMQTLCAKRFGRDAAAVGGSLEHMHV